MFERIDPRSPTPIYAQIAERIRVAVAAGELTKGDGLPSVRALATRLRVNPATVVQAYRELEQEKLVEMRQGAGTYILEMSTDSRARERTAAAKRLVRGLMEEAARLGIQKEDIKKALNGELSEGGR
ncbi:MAG TPA: GntR family transcriptional regulator [Gemmatimonadaceae bacterium]|jgi:GntR family transcriptional regulator|nr:GntR family transcriptional regulator [Gemmatimonadaceae bacterium]